MRLRAPTSAFRSQTAPAFEDEDAHVLDAAFVGDEGIILVTRNGETLGKAIYIMLLHVFTVFEDARLEINTPLARPRRC